MNIAQYSFLLFLVSGVFGLLIKKNRVLIREKLFLVFLFYTVFSELLGNYFFLNKQFSLIPTPINIYIYVSNVFFLVFIGSLLKTKLSLYLMLFSVFIFTAFYIYDIFYFDELYRLKSYVIGTILVLLMSSFYLITVLKSSQINTIDTTLFFWVIVGILLFIIPFLPYFIYINIFKAKNYYDIYSSVIFFLNLIMNICFIIGFYRSRKNYNSLY